LFFLLSCAPATAHLVRQVVFGERGVLAGITPGKKYIDMSTVDEACAVEIATAVRAKGGLFVEAPVSGSKGPAALSALVRLWLIGSILNLI
jgi:3-hydroxyisobutyrate dehydrogenase-like beta-hydroxyacid dehydrogenase